VKIGKAGLTDAVVATVDERVKREGLVKVGTADVDADEVARALAERLGPTSFRSSARRARCGESRKSDQDDD
jgi:RNA-binding protein YhbY